MLMPMLMSVPARAPAIAAARAMIMRRVITFDRIFPYPRVHVSNGLLVWLPFWREPEMICTNIYLSFRYDIQKLPESLTNDSNILAKINFRDVNNIVLRRKQTRLTQSSCNAVIPLLYGGVGGRADRVACKDGGRW